MKKTNRRIALAVVLTLCITLLAGTITVRASISEDIGVRWWRMNQAHEGAEIARRLGGVAKAMAEQWSDFILNGDPQMTLF